MLGADSTITQGQKITPPKNTANAWWIPHRGGFMLLVSLGAYQFDR